MQLIEFMIQPWPAASPKTPVAWMGRAGAGTDDDDGDGGDGSESEEHRAPTPQHLGNRLASANPTPVHSPRVCAPASLSGSVMNNIWEMSEQEENDMLTGIIKKATAKRTQLANSHATVGSSLRDCTARQDAAARRSGDIRLRKEECAKGKELEHCAVRDEALLMADAERFRLGLPPLQATVTATAQVAQRSSAAKRSADEMAGTTAANIERLQEKRRALDREIDQETVRGVSEGLAAQEAGALLLADLSTAAAATAAFDTWETGSGIAAGVHASYKLQNDLINVRLHASNITQTAEVAALEEVDVEECKRDVLSVKALTNSRKKLVKQQQSLLQWGSNPARIVSGSASASTSTSHVAHSGIDAHMFAGDTPTHVSCESNGTDPFGGNLLFGDMCDDSLFN